MKTITISFDVEWDDAPNDDVPCRLDITQDDVLRYMEQFVAIGMDDAADTSSREDTDPECALDAEKAASIAVGPARITNN